MMIGWFDLPLFIIVMAGLFAGGVIFNFLNEKSGTIYPSWFLHMFANFAINTVGFVLFGIIWIVMYSVFFTALWYNGSEKRNER